MVPNGTRNRVPLSNCLWMTRAGCHQQDGSHSTVRGEGAEQPRVLASWRLVAVTLGKYFPSQPSQPCCLLFLWYGRGGIVLGKSLTSTQDS